MEMSKACLPPRQPAISEKARQHPLFPIYQRYRSSMAANLVEASAFNDWLFQYESEQRNNEAAKHPRMAEFVAWMRETQGGARPCPVLDATRTNFFPHNFYYWLEGGRW